MAWMLTDYGAQIVCNLVSGQWASRGPENGSKFVWLLGAAPPLDRTRVDKSQYTILGTVDPVAHEIDSSMTALATIVDGRAVVQWGPPALVYAATENCTVYGIVVINEENKVSWFDRFNTPVTLETGQTISVIPAYRATSECPPLGGC